MKYYLIAGGIVILAALILASVAVSGLGQKYLSRQEQTVEIGGDDVESGLVAKVIDGNTVELSDKRRVRYLGLADPKETFCFAKEATAKNKELVLNKTIRIERDATNRDQNGKLLRYVYIESPDGEIFANDYLLRQGFARVLNVPPDLKFERQFNQAADEAKFQNRGLWASCY